MMVNYRSAVRHYGIGLIMSLLLFSFTAGCVTQKTTTPGTTVKVKGRRASLGDSASLPGTIDKIWVNPEADTFEVWIQGSGALIDYTSIKQSFPFAVSVYLPNVRLSPGVDAGSFSDTRVSGVTVGFVDEAQTTVKVDILLKADLPYIVEESPDRLGIILKGRQASVEPMPGAVPVADDPGQGLKETAALPEDVPIPETTAHLTHIEFDKANVGLSAGQKFHAGFKESDRGQPTAQEKKAYLGQDPLLNPSSVRYTGEKIKLDFYETDIKNVFRILKSVGGVNFAIDKDVQGKVTLSLEDPVPWDQILDLVLKMNSLGKKMEGNVIRIATTETLAREENERQEAIAARQKFEDQKRALEPLVTEYLPVNYSDAKADIEPHISQILTPDRGKISVDTRTNMLIITDTQAKIIQANELIYRLDKVTPQIMIEAKIVEVTKEFSRSFGVNWNLSNASAVTSGFVDDYSVSVNGSENVGISGNFSFFGLFGSSVSALNAKLEASEEQGDVRIVSSPRILTLDNKKAMIKQGQEYAYKERDDSGGSSVAYKDIDLLLEVTPHVTPDNRISMTVRLTKNDVAGIDSEGVPSLATNEAETELLVNNNDTVVIGGVVKTTQSQDSDGIPFLAGVPGLGYLFSSKAKADDRNELLIFLTPSIVQLEQKRHIVK